MEVDCEHCTGALRGGCRGRRRQVAHFDSSVYSRSLPLLFQSSWTGSWRRAPGWGSEISACFTRILRKDLLLHMGTGIPELGIHSVDPFTVPSFTFTLLDTGLLS